MLAFNHSDHGCLPYVHGTPTVDDWREFLATQAGFLTLNQALGWSGELGELARIGTANGRGLLLLPLDAPFDVAALEAISGLGSLHLDKGCKGRLRAARHDSLASLTLRAEATLKVDLEGADRLQTFSTNGAALKAAASLANLPALRSLTLSRPGFGPETMPCGLGLHALEVYGWSRLVDLAWAPASLRELRLRSNRHLRDYSALSGMVDLEELLLDDCGPLPSLDVLLGMKRLRSVRLQGTRLLDSIAEAELAARGVHVFH